MQLQLEASVGYIDYDRVDPGPSRDCAGRCRTATSCTAPRTPEWTAAVGATYEWGLGEWRFDLSVRGDATYQSKMFFGTDPINGFQDAHTLVDARLTWESADQGWAMCVVRHEPQRTRSTSTAC